MNCIYRDQAALCGAGFVLEAVNVTPTKIKNSSGKNPSLHSHNSDAVLAPKNRLDEFIPNCSKLQIDKFVSLEFI